MKKTKLAVFVSLSVALLTFTVFTATLQAQTLVSKWRKPGVGSQNNRGMAYNPSTGNLLLVQSGKVLRFKSSDGASAGDNLIVTGVSGGLLTLCGIAVDADGVIYASSYAAGGTTIKIYKWPDEATALTAGPTVVWSGTYGVSAERIGAILSVTGTGNNAQFIIAGNGTSAAYVYHNGTTWTSKTLTCGNQTMTSGAVFIDYNNGGSGKWRILAKTGQTGGVLYSFNPTAASPIAMDHDKDYSAAPLGFVSNGIHDLAYDPVTGLIGACTRVSSTSPFPFKAYLLSTTGANSITSPAQLSSDSPPNATQGDTGSVGGASWGNGVLYTSASAAGAGLNAYNITAFKVSDLSPASATKNAGDSITFSVVSGGSGLSYQWTKDGTAIPGATAAALTISPLATSDTGSYSCTVNGVSSSTWTSSSGVLTVNPVDTTIALTSSSDTASYGDSVTFMATVSPTTSLGPTGLVTFKDGTTTIGSATLSDGVATFTTSALSTTESPHSITASYEGDANYNASTSTALTQVVNQKTLTPIISVGSKVYDGTVSATITAWSLAGVVGSEDVVLTIAGTAEFSDAKAGSGKTVTVPGLSLSGASAGNYVLPSATAITTADIAPAPLTITASAQSKIYGDALSLAGTEFTTTALQNGETVGSVTLTSSGFAATASAGSHSISPSVATGGTFDPANYNITYVDGTLTVNKAVLTVSANGELVYGSTTPVYTPVFAGLLNGDTASVVTGEGTFSTDVTATSYVGTNYVVHVVDTGTLSADNYSFVAGPDGVMTVTNKPLTVSGITASGKVYDATTTATVDASGAALEGIVNNDDTNPGAVSLDASSASGAFVSKAAGEQTVQISGLALLGDLSTNYVLIQPTTTATITPAPLTVAAQGVNKNYDGTTAATVLLSVTPLDGDEVTAAYGAAAFDSKNVGAGKAVTVSGITLAGADAANYAANDTAATTADIIATPLTVSATGVSRTYDGTAAATVTLSTTALAGDSVSASYASASFEDKNVGPGKPVSVSGISLSGDDAGNYTFNATASTSADISPRTLTASATGLDKVYDSTPAAAVTLAGDQLPGDMLTLDYATAAFADAAVGPAKPIDVSGISISGGADAGNYALAATTASAAASITPRPLTITANSRSKTYGDTVTFVGTEFTVDGLVGADAVAGVTLASAGASAAATVPGAPYPIVASDAVGAGLSNYAIAYVDGALTVDKAGTTIALASSGSPVALGHALTLTAAVSAGATGSVDFFDGATLLGSSAVSGSEAVLATSTLSAGSHSLMAVYGGDDNHNASTSAALSQTVCAPPEITSYLTNFTLTADVGTCQAILPDATGPAYITAVDSCSGSVAVTQDPPANTPLPLGTNTLTWTITGGVGNSTTFAHDVVVLEPAPSIVTQPQSQTNIVDSGVDTVLSVSAIACSAKSYQWYLPTGPLADATNSTLVFHNVQLADAGSYQVVVTSSGGSATSAVAVLTVRLPMIATDDALSGFMNTALTVSTSRLLANDVELNGFTLTVLSVTPTSTRGGTVALSGSTITYTPPASFYGVDGFDYTVGNGNGQTATAHVAVTVVDGVPPVSVKASISPIVGGFRISFTGVVGHTYQVQRSTDMTHWTTLATRSATPQNRVIQYDDTDAPPAGAFYRVAAQ